MTCTWDSGSATGCQPACDDRATTVSTRTCYGGPLEVKLCDRHTRALPARIHPDTVTGTRPLTGS